MKKIIILFLLFLSFDSVFSFCCKDPLTGQDKCYSTGMCCDGYWYPHCYNFELDVRGPPAFRIGQKTVLLLYVKNTGTYSDSYDISYHLTSVNPSLILVDMEGASEATNVDPGEIVTLYPKITILSSLASGTLTFKGVSRSMPTLERTTDFLINEASGYLSLPEFSVFWTLQLMILAIVLFLISKNKFIS